MIEYNADRMPIGIFDMPDKNYTVHDIKTVPGDMIYMFSDGYADQFGGPYNKKFMYASFKEILIKVHQLPVQKQKQNLENRFNEWKGAAGQIDDVLIIGFRI